MRSHEKMDETKRLMAALGRMPPKQHKDMKLGKASGKKNESPRRKATTRDRKR